MAVRGRSHKTKQADGQCNWCQATLTEAKGYTLVDLKITREFCPKGKCYELGKNRMVKWALEREQKLNEKHANRDEDIF